MILDAEYYQNQAEALHEREREIKAARGEIIDGTWNGVVLATNRTVCTISVIHSQVEDPETGDPGCCPENFLRWMRRQCGKGWRRSPPWRRIQTNVEKEIRGQDPGSVILAGSDKGGRGLQTVLSVS